MTLNGARVAATLLSGVVLAAASDLRPISHGADPFEHVVLARDEAQTNSTTAGHLVEHDDSVDWAVAGGIIAAIVVVAIIFCVFWRVYRARKDAKAAAPPKKTLRNVEQAPTPNTLAKNWKAFSDGAYFLNLDPQGGPAATVASMAKRLECYVNYYPQKSVLIGYGQDKDRRFDLRGTYDANNYTVKFTKTMKEEETEFEGEHGADSITGRFRHTSANKTLIQGTFVMYPNHLYVEEDVEKRRQPVEINWDAIPDQSTPSEFKAIDPSAVAELRKSVEEAREKRSRSNSSVGVAPSPQNPKGVVSRAPSVRGRAPVLTPASLPTTAEEPEDTTQWKEMTDKNRPLEIQPTRLEGSKDASANRGKDKGKEHHRGKGKERSGGKEKAKERTIAEHVPSAPAHVPTPVPDSMMERLPTAMQPVNSRGTKSLRAPTRQSSELFTGLIRMESQIGIQQQRNAGTSTAGSQGLAAAAANGNGKPSSPAKSPASKSRERRADTGSGSTYSYSYSYSYSY